MTEGDGLPRYFYVILSAAKNLTGTDSSVTVFPQNDMGERIPTSGFALLGMTYTKKPPSQGGFFCIY